MIGTLWRRHLVQHARLLVALCAGLVALETLIVWIANQIEDGPGFEALITTLLPPLFARVIQSQIGVLSLDGAVGFGFQHPINLTASVAFTLVVATLPALEREGGMLELVLSRPVPRRSYLAAVVLTLVVGSVALPASLLAGAAAGIELVQSTAAVPWIRYLQAGLGFSSLLLCLGGITLWIAAGARRRGPAVAWAAGVTLTLFWVDLLAEFWEPLRIARPLSPFYWFDPVGNATGLASSWVGTVVLFAFFVATTLAAVFRFQRHDV